MLTTFFTDIYFLVFRDKSSLQFAGCLARIINMLTDNEKVKQYWSVLYPQNQSFQAPSATVTPA